MRRVAFGAWLFAFFLPPLCAQSVVLVSPSTQGQHSLACSADSLHSFEELHYLAVTHYLADKLCGSTRIEGAVGLWHGQAENSGMIDGCAASHARELGALLGKYYHQKAALVFDRSEAGNASLVSFHATRPLGAIATAMTQIKVTGATVIPGAHDNWILMVSTDDQQRTRAHRLYSLLKGRALKQEPGTAELIGSDNRLKARNAYEDLLAKAPAVVRQLDQEMYTEHFNDLGMEAEPK